uniref:Uncharacterized protein n=1 Tax=Lepeophtheirus salmonis TaxID=72036 RepID=A0A0K2TND3_LEPSM
MHLVKTITVLPLAFICHWANADLGFFGEVHGHHVKKTKTNRREVLHDVPFKYRQKESVDLDPYSLDFDFLHEGDDSPKTPPYTNSGTDLSSSSPYKPPALIGQFKTNDYSPYKDQGSFKPSAPSGPSGFESLYPKGKINNFEYKKPEIHSPSPVYDQYKESTPIYHKSPTTYGSSKPAIFNPTSFGQGKDYEGDVKSHISGGYEGEIKSHLSGGYEGEIKSHIPGGYEGEIKSHPSGGYEEPKANYDDYESEDYSSSYSPPPPNYQREKPQHHVPFVDHHDNGGDFKDSSHDSFGHPDYDDHSHHGSPHQGGKDYDTNDDHHGKNNHDSQNSNPSYLRVEYGYGTSGSQVKYSYHHGYKNHKK